MRLLAKVCGSDATSSIPGKYTVFRVDYGTVSILRSNFGLENTYSVQSRLWHSEHFEV